MVRATVIATDESIRVSSSTTIADGVAGAPYSSGIVMPINPSSASSATTRTGSGLAVELLGDRRDALLRELANRGADELVLLGQVEVHAAGDAIRRAF